MRRKLLWTGFILSLIILTGLILRVVSGEDGWICTDNGWAKHGNPSAPEPTTLCGQTPLPIITPAQSGSEKLTPVQIFFSNIQTDPDTLNCGTTYGANREVYLSDSNKYLTVIKELLQGPSDYEKNLGFFTSINPNIALPTITFADGILTANFAVDLEANTAGSCRVSAIRSQLDNTLKQFPEVQQVVISIDGRTADILQP